MAVSYGDRYSVEQQILEEQEQRGQDAITNAINLAGTRGAGMMLRARGIGESRGEMYNALGRMLTGEEEPIDPRLARQNALQKIFEQYGNPQNYEDMVEIANVLRTSGFPDEADLAMKQANDYKTAQTNALNAKTSANKAPTRDTEDYIKIVNGKKVVYSKLTQWNPSTQQWDFVSEAPKYAPDSATALGKDLLMAAKTFPNANGTKGCDLNEDFCYMYAVDKVNQAKKNETEFDKVLGGAMGDELVEVRKEALTGFKTIGTINNSFRSLNSAEVISGFAAEPRLSFAKAIGVLTGDENKRIQATELWLASTAGLVTEIMGSGDLGAGTGLSDNDIKFAKAMVAGSIELDENSVRRILWMRRILEVEKIKRWNERYKNLPEAIKESMTAQGLNPKQAIVDIPTWDENMIYLKPPKGHIELKAPDETVYYYWPANPEYDVNTIQYKGETYTVHDKNGFDITATVKKGQ